MKILIFVQNYVIKLDDNQLAMRWKMNWRVKYVSYLSKLFRAKNINISVNIFIESRLFILLTMSHLNRVSDS